jgi:hypothetical protein
VRFIDNNLTDTLMILIFLINRIKKDISKYQRHFRLTIVKPIIIDNTDKDQEPHFQIGSGVWTEVCRVEM